MDWKAFWNESPQVQDPDVCRQVGRTWKAASYTENQIRALTERLLSLLRPSPHQSLLDVACGNGLITSRLAAHYGRVTAIDFSRPLIDVARRRFSRDNVSYAVGDAFDLEVEGERYDAVLLSAALQFFDVDQAARLLGQLARVVKGGGRVVLGDVPDRDRVWRFYRGLPGRLRYGFDLARRRPIIGHWWRPKVLVAVAAEAGWTATIHYQTPDNPNHYFRYDAVLERPADPTPGASGSARGSENRGTGARA